MANKTIPELGQVYTASDLDYLVITNSGETTTSKITRQDLLSGTDIAGGLVNGTGTNSLKSADNLTSTAAVSSNTNSIALGNGAKASGSNSITIGTSTMPSGNNSINIGLHYNSADNVINIGNGAYTYQANGISIGQSSGSQQGGIVLGNSSRAGKTGSLTFGNNNEHNQGNYSVSIGNEVRNGIAPNYYGAEYSVAIGHNHKLEGNTENGQNYSTILGGSGNILTGNTTNVVLLGLNNFTSPAANNTTYVDKLYSVGKTINGTNNDLLVGGSGNYFTQLGTEGSTNILVGGQNNYIENQNTLSAGNGRGSVIAGGQSCYIKHRNNGNNHFIAASSGSYIDSGYGQNGIIATANSYITGNAYHFIGGGRSNKITGTDDNGMVGGNSNRVDGNYGFIGGGTNNFQRGNSSVILGGVSNQISANKHQSFIGGGISNTLSHTNSAMIASSGRTSLYDLTLHTDNIHTYKTETFSVVNGGNVGGNVDVDCSLGTIFTFTMTANTTPNFINLRTGQRFMFIINNTTYNVPAATINGVSGNVYAKNGTISPSSNSITKYTATYDGTRLFLDEEGAFDAV